MIPHSQSERLRLNKIPKNGYGIDEIKFLERLILDFPDLKFIAGSKFAFRPPRTIVVGPKEPAWRALLLHELGHAASGHNTYETDVKRLKMEVQAWEKAKELALCYGVVIDEDLIQDELETYRGWLHQKSRCPECGLTRFQTHDGTYHCPRCENFYTN